MGYLGHPDILVVCGGVIVEVVSPRPPLLRIGWKTRLLWKVLSTIAMVAVGDIHNL